jgi:hypothetical protein
MEDEPRRAVRGEFKHWPRIIAGRDYTEVI